MDRMVFFGTILAAGLLCLAGMVNGKSMLRTKGSSLMAHGNRAGLSPQKLMEKPYKNVVIPSPDGDIDYSPDNLPVWMRPDSDDVKEKKLDCGSKAPATEEGAGQKKEGSGDAKVDSGCDQSGGGMQIKLKASFFRKPVPPPPPLETPDQSAVYGGNFMGDGSKPMMFTPQGGKGEGALNHAVLFPPEDYKILAGGAVSSDSELGKDPKLYMEPPGKPKVKGFGAPMPKPAVDTTSSKASGVSKGKIGMYTGPPIPISPAMGTPALEFPGQKSTDVIA